MRTRRKLLGFTAIELIIVIAIIAILAALVYISYIGLTAKARENAFRFNAKSVLRSLLAKETGDETFDPLAVNEANLAAQLGMSAENYSELTVYKYENNDYVYIVGQLQFNHLIACGTQYDMNVYNADDASCPLGGSAYIVPKVDDPTPGSFGGGDGSTCTLAMTIDSIEDLVTLSNSVNSGTTYSGKCLKLAADLDFFQNKSYVNPSRTDFGDINGDGTIQALKQEVTWMAGFNPIGNSTNKFSGNFQGEQHTIYNLQVKRLTTDYIGLFGYLNNATVTALNLTAASISGQDYVGTLFGYAYNSKITEAILTGDIAARNYTGLAGGYLRSQSGLANLTSISTEGNITGADYIGGIIGYTYTWLTGGDITGVYKGGTMTSTGSNINRIRGGLDNNSGTFKLSGIASSTTTINGSTISCSYQTDNDGTDIENLADLNDINVSEQVRDTYIGGDNDSDGYYWDYDGSGTLVLKNTTTNPITFDLIGSGTSGDPYLIYDYDDLRQASAKLSSYHKLMANIDMSNQKFYMIGSYFNNFTGDFNGNTKTISNLTIDAPEASYVGFIGYNKGGLTLLNFINANLTGQNYAGILSGYIYNGKVTESTVSGNVTGNDYVGLANGSMYNSYSNPRLTSITVEGDVTGYSYVGGLMGYAYSYSMTAGYISGIYKGGNIIATGANYNRIRGKYDGAGGCEPFLFSGVAMSSVTINGSTVSSTYQTNNHGSDIANLSDMNEINIAEQALDTYIGGDDDNNGYYWDYDGSGSVVLKSVATNPLTFDLAGSGTSGDPYQVYDYDDLRQASMRLSSYHKLMADINMSGQKFYMMGSYFNKLTGSFNGNTKTISNLTLNASKSSFVGFSGYCKGIITLLNFTNSNILGQNYTGTLFGYGVNANVTEDTVNGNVTGSNYVGLGGGYLYNDYSTPRLTSITVEGNVTGADYVGGLLGYSYSFSLSAGTISGLYKGGSIVKTGTNANRIRGGSGNGGGAEPYIFGGVAMASVTINGSTIESNDSVSNQGVSIASMGDLTSNINVAEVALDTYIGGDDDNNGYYWDYDGGGTVAFKNTTTYPLTFDLSGSGTSADPYLVYDYNDLKQASLKLSSYHKLMSDINMSGMTLYTLGSNQTRFSGNFNGNYYTISGITLNAPKVSFLGFSGYNKGTIKNVNLTNESVSGYNYTGGVAGYDTGTIMTINSSSPTITGNSYTGGVSGVNNGSVRGIKITGANVSGNSNVGGIVGLNEMNKTTKDCIVTSGNISGTGNYVSLGVGYNSYATVINYLVDGSASSTAGYVGGVVGRSAYSSAKGINKGGSIVGTSYVGRTLGSASSSGTKATYGITSITVNGSTVSSTDTASTHGADISAADLTTSTIYTNLGFNFTDEAQDYIWYIDGAAATFRKGASSPN
jgi:prepilin-type N-terminal cleavage/methylation domain-containing protein